VVGCEGQRSVSPSSNDLPTRCDDDLNLLRGRNAVPAGPGTDAGSAEGTCGAGCQPERRTPRARLAAATSAGWGAPSPLSTARGVGSGVEAPGKSAWKEWEEGGEGGLGSDERPRAAAGFSGAKRATLQQGESRI
jgi:hypothetical protein